MTEGPSRITLDQWRQRYAKLTASGLREPDYGGPLERHLEAGDRRLRDIQFDNSAASLRLWNFLLTEEDRLRRARDDGAVLVGAMKDLGTVPVLAFSPERGKGTRAAHKGLLLVIFAPSSWPSPPRGRRNECCSYRTAASDLCPLILTFSPQGGEGMRAAHSGLPLPIFAPLYGPIPDCKD